MDPEGTDLLQTRLRDREDAENEPFLDSDNDSDERTTAVEAKAAMMRRMKMITLTLVIETNLVMSSLPSSMTKKLRG